MKLKSTGRIWLSSPHMGGTEQKYVKEAFDTNWVAPLGPNVNSFEEALENYVGGNMKAAALSSGTAAIHLALILLGVEHGDEVICQSFTFSGSANPIMYQGAIPVFVDSDAETWNISPVHLKEAIEDRITKGKKPKAIIAVHLYGMPYKVHEVNEIAKAYDIPVIEDAAEALGSRVGVDNCGSFGDLSILSFNGNKIITTSGGGALLCRDDETKNRTVFLSTQARDKAPHYEHSTVGYNYRMSNIVAGIGRGQMEVLDDRVAARRNVYKFYEQHLKSNANIAFLDEAENSYSNRWLSCIVTPSYDFREKIRLGLLEDDIESRPLWKPMHMQPIFENYPYYGSRVSEDLFYRGLCLPSGSNMTDGDLERILNQINKYI